MRRPGRTLWSRPAFAHRASVDRLTWMLEAARISAASPSVIQSLGGRGMRQSDVKSEADAGAVLPGLDESPDADESAAGFGFEAFADDEEAARASFFAQPEPLKTMAGGDRSFRIAPPQCSHVFGPWAWTPCITSTVRWHSVQM